MARAIAQTYTLTREYGMEIAAALLIACGILSAVYGLSIYSVISHTVALEKIQRQTASVSSAVDELDMKYIGISSKITPDVLKSYGFHEGQISEFISRPGNIGTASLVGHEL